MKKFYRSVFISGAVILFMGICSSAMAEDVQIHGFISQGYLKTDKNNYLADTDDGTFQFNEMGINFTTYATQRLKIGCQFFARDLGSVGNDDMVVNWAFAEYNFRNWLGLRAGLIKIPFGFYNDTRDYDSLRTAIFLPSSVYYEYFRDGTNNLKGIEIFGSQSIGILGMLKYQLLTGETQIPLDSGTAELVSKILYPDMDIINMDVGPVYTANLQWLTFVDGLRLGFTYSKTDYTYEGINNGTIDVKFKATSQQWSSISIEYVWNNLVIAAENYMSKRDADIEYSTSNGLIAKSDADIDQKNDSYYIRLSYRFTDWLESGYYYSKYIQDPDLSGDKNKNREQCLSFRFDINPYWLFKLETHLMDGKFGVKPDNDGHTYDEWMLYAAKMTFMF